MRRILWGIAIVFCLQVAFQLAMTADRTDTNYAALRTPLQKGIDIPSPTLDVDDLETNIVPIEAETTRKKAPVETRVLIRYIRVPDHSHPAEPRTTNAAFKPVVITYDRTGALTAASATAERRVFTKQQEPSTDDKRSLIAKVVTKPYDWLKAAGSKLR